jgi:hypothetical protein
VKGYATKMIRMRWRYPLLLFALAVGLFLVGLAYGVVMVGVPTQDPTPAIAAAEARDIRISSWGMLVGACLFVVSVVWLAVITIAKRIGRKAAA